MDYRFNVEMMFEQNSDAMVNNSCIEHAQVLIETLIDRAEKSLVFLCRSLKPDFYNHAPMIDRFVNAINRGVNIRILTQQPVEARDLVSELEEARREPGQLEIRECQSQSKLCDQDINFVVMDGKAFRFEHDLDRHIATASANRPDLAERMVVLFERYWKDGTPLVS